MNYTELEQKLGKQTKSDWHQASGGGWIHKNAKVENEDNIRGNAIVTGNARVSGNAWVSGNAMVSGNARVYGNAMVFGNAKVSGDAWEKSPLYLLDSRNHGATNCKHGWLKIGCEEHTFQDWDKNFDQIAIKHNLTNAEKIEYRAIIDLFIKIGK